VEPVQKQSTAGLSSLRSGAPNPRSGSGPGVLVGNKGGPQAPEPAVDKQSVVADKPEVIKEFT
jgi:hypothetical protein